MHAAVTICPYIEFAEKSHSHLFIFIHLKQKIELARRSGEWMGYKALLVFVLSVGYSRDPFKEISMVSNMKACLLLHLLRLSQKLIKWKSLPSNGIHRSVDNVSTIFGRIKLEPAPFRSTPYKAKTIRINHFF